MKLKALLTEAEYNALPEQIKQAYAKQGEQYVLDLDDKGFNEKLKEFRDNNISLTKKLEEAQKLAEKYKDVDIEKYNKAIEEYAKLEEIAEKDLIKAGKFEQVVAQRTMAKQREFEQKLSLKEKELETAREDGKKYKGMHGKLLVETTVGNHVGGIAVPRKNSIPLITNLAHEHFTVDDNGRLTAREGKINAKGEAMTVEDFGAALLADHAYLFESAGGGGAGGGNKKTSQPGVKYIDRDPVLIGQHAKEIQAGTVVVKD